MLDIFRDSTFGSLLNTVSGGRLLPHPDQTPGWKPPNNLETPPNEEKTLDENTEGEVSKKPAASVKEVGSSTPRDTSLSLISSDVGQVEKGSPKNIIGWYDDNDQENPKNWSLAKRVAVTGLVCLLTFSVYIGSAIYTASIPGIVDTFHVSQSTATLGLSLYVIGYGIGPIIFSPLSEIPSIGRRPIYIITLLIFVALQVPTLYANNIHTLLAMRFFAGFFGSPALATGGASIQDMFHHMKLPYAIIAWSVTALCGPVLGPIVGGFAAEAKGWKWPIWELLWLCGFTIIVLIFWFPETNAETILLRRARRIRKRTGVQNIFSESEIRQAHMHTSEVLFESLWRPFQLMMEPVIFYVDIYIAIGYATFYLWFEAFPLVYNDIYHFSLGESGLPFIGLLLSAAITGACYLTYNYYVIERDYKRTGIIIPESRLIVALVAAPFGPISLLVFGWTARESIHWIVPTIGAALYLPGLFLFFQSAVVYLPLSYPNYAASILAGNGLFRSAVAGAFPIFGRAMYTKLTVGGGCSLLAGISIAFAPGIWVLWKYGAQIRAKSKYATGTN
ncbi:hypothetical protein D9619_009703 [Psilocybe cf. subviscida]|uniref:Major facilitator superfamily (MFS) profile domain-containing protein n=1 Tax=Psilocybe cf. subviscida TaxID=2480587 RepID=A0A8H5BLA6_9AGAR|nr:hypothetical protein D9619_009703 [Psilocybe cf. subviscida]